MLRQIARSCNGIRGHVIATGIGFHVQEARNELIAESIFQNDSSNLRDLIRSVRCEKPEEFEH